MLNNFSQSLFLEELVGQTFDLTCSRDFEDQDNNNTKLDMNAGATLSKAVSEPWRCFVCDFKSESNLGLMRHIDKNHRMGFDTDRSEPPVEVLSSTPVNEKRKQATRKTKSSLKVKVPGLTPRRKKSLSCFLDFKQRRASIVLNGSKCSKCDFLTTDKDLLEKHRESHRSSLRNSGPEPKITELSGAIVINGLKCPKCSFMTTCADVLSCHKKSKHSRKC